MEVALGKKECKYSDKDKENRDIFINSLKLEQEDKDILFKDSKHKDINKFYISMENHIGFQLKEDSEVLKLNYIIFPENDNNVDIYSLIVSKLGDKPYKIKEIHFWYCHFYSEININKVIIKHQLHFGKVTFHKEIKFNKSNFKKRIDFLETYFKKDAFFQGTKFKGEAHFWNTTVYKSIQFNSAESSNIFSLKDSKINQIDLEGMIFDKINMLRLKGFKENKEIELSKANFLNKESARLIKLHFETEKNITEANKFFKIEQELYLEELKDSKSTHTNKKITKIVLYLNKYISNFGTDWIRPLFLIIVFSFFVSLIYNYIEIPKGIKVFKELSKSNNLYYSLGGFLITLIFYLTYVHNTISWILISIIPSYILLMWLLFYSYPSFILNDIALIMNPLNMFKSKDYFEHIAPFGMFVKLVISVLLYQFIMAFRNNTRRT